MSTRTLIHALVVPSLLALSVFTTGCKGGNACDKLAAKICEGKDAAQCTKAKAALDEALGSGPDGKKITAEERGLGCSMIMEDPKAVESYVTAINGKIADKK